MLKELREHRIASPSALTGPQDKSLQLGGTQNQNSQASVFECHSASAELIACKNQAFGCAGTPKVPNEPREHRIASPSAFPSSLNDFPQLGGTQNQNSQNASIFEYHSASAELNTQKEQNFGCEDIPKRLKKLLEHRKASPSAFTESLNDFLQWRHSKSKLAGCECL